MTPTSLFDKVLECYKYMDDHAELTELDERAYHGYMGDAFKAAGCVARYHSMVRDILLSPDLDPCIEIRQRGNSKQLSIVVLRHPPPESWRGLSPGGLTSPGAAATLRGLEQRLAAIEAWRESSFKGVNILEVMKDFERRLTLMESETGVEA